MTLRTSGESPIVSRLARLRIPLFLCVLCAVFAAVVLPLLCQPATAQAVARGLSAYALWGQTAPNAAVTDPVIDEIGSNGLRARWTVLAVKWPTAQPSAPPAAYDEAYFAYLDDVISKLHAAGVRVILSTYYVPRWASDQSLWNSPPAGYDSGYQQFYPPSAAYLGEFGKLGAELARRFSRYGVLYECWNEPNLLHFLYPQTQPGDAYFGVGNYLKMLKVYSEGVKGVAPGATVIAGATGPYGANNAVTTSPQRFAQYLKDNGAAAYFDAYSHHPYAVSGEGPSEPPYDGTTTVNMSNISQLLRIFPKKPFYLDEYGYSTKASPTGLTPVTEAQQASYLRQAFAMVAKHRQVKVLVWYYLQDYGTWYTGLKSADGSPKPAYYAFAGRNSITLSTPASVHAAKSFSVSGVLRGRDGVLAGKRVELQTRSQWQSAWTTVGSTHTRADGSYVFAGVKQTTARYYRASFSGVCLSVKSLVRTP